MARELAGRRPCLFLNRFRAQGRSWIDSVRNKTLTAEAWTTPWRQRHCLTLFYSPDSLPTWGKPLWSFSLSDKPAFDLCTERAMYYQMMTVTCTWLYLCRIYVGTGSTQRDQTLEKAFIGIASILKHSISPVKFLTRENLVKTMQHRSKTIFCMS